MVGVFAGFDEPRTLGRHETGSSVAVPVFKEFMKEALEGTPPTPFRIPPGVRQVQINAETGARARPDKMYILDGKGISLMPSMTGSSSEAGATVGTGGLY